VVLLLRRRKSAKLERLLRIAVITGVAAALVTLLAYLPFTIAYSSYLQAKTAHEAYFGITLFAGFGYLPSGLNSFFTTFRGHMYLWSLVILIGAAVMVWRVVVHIQNARTRPA
jgi:zinc transporter ZupT